MIIELVAVRVAATAAILTITTGAFLAWAQRRNGLDPGLLFQTAAFTMILLVLTPLVAVLAPVDRGIVDIREASVAKIGSDAFATEPALSPREILPADEGSIARERADEWVARQLSEQTPTGIAAPLWLIAAWAVGTCLVGAYYLAGHLQMISVVRHSRSISDAEDVGVRVTGRVAAPCVALAWKPTILVPPSFVRKPSVVWEAVIAHERQHINRGDLWWALLAQVVTAAMWWLPPAWYLRSQLLLHAEINADLDAAAALGHKQYLAGLAKAILQVHTQPTSAATVGMPSRLRRRIELLSRGTATRRPRHGGRLRWAIAFTGTLTALIAFPAFARDETATRILEAPANESYIGSVSDGSVSSLTRHLRGGEMGNALKIVSPELGSVLESTTPVVTWSTAPAAETFSLSISREVEGASGIIRFEPVFQADAITARRLEVPKGILKPGARYRLRVEGYWQAGIPVAVSDQGKAYIIEIARSAR
jgi:beta-lactamase regulating signal transducer with metallopeptidase domain